MAGDPPSTRSRRGRPRRDRSGPEAEAAAQARSEARRGRVERRRASVPAITYPEQLPVSARRDDIAAAIRDHQVVVIAGETGSGKTTQLPKICLELGRGVEGMIGHTQPRRLAARTVATRIAEEVGRPLGETIGYAVRFTDQVGEDTLVKVMTDGILLTDIHRDRQLRAYDTIIIDEAHERSLNVDFLLGYLKQLLPKRPDLKVIVTSATIDPERFAEHFATPGPDGERVPAPIIEVSGRTYPVEVRYRPLDGSGDGVRGATRFGLDDEEPADDDDDVWSDLTNDDLDAPVLAEKDPITAICDAVQELRREGPGDVLVFLSGEREIRDTADALTALRLHHTEILPLYARLSTAEQHRVFAPHDGRRIVLATNVAETSLTVPGIRYVVDAGTARISRYSNRLKVQRLPIEPVSRASADQRAGRCGRVAPGICIRLYSQTDYERRPQFTEPEILRTNLASVILQMTSLGLGEIAAFPFLDPPDRRSIADGIRLLHELGALETDQHDERQRLTPLGRRLARLPLDPRFGRMVLEADKEGCLREVLIIVAALSIEDPRERPAEHKGKADQLHARFADESSDFMAYLNLWHHVREQQRELGSSRFRKLCKAEFLHHLRIREWQDVHSQLRRITGELDMRSSGGNEPAEGDRIHRALLAGLLSHLGMKDRDTREYRGARNSRFVIHPGSALARKQPPWIMAAELVETSRLFARTAARVQPEWAEELAPHLVSYSYAEPHWSARRATVRAYESVSLFGLPIVTRRTVNYGTIDPERARELFIEHALVQGEWATRHRFVAGNRAALEAAERMAHRFRVADALDGDEALYRLYSALVGEAVTSGRQFDGWYKRARQRDPDVLTFTPEQLLGSATGGLHPEDVPEEWVQGEWILPLSYAHEPGQPWDGVTVHIPVAVLNQISSGGFDWQVPGFRVELVEALIRSLPKAVRRELVPVAESAAAVLERLTPLAEPLLPALARELGRRAGAHLAARDFDLERVPSYLRMTFLVEDDDGSTLAEGKDLDALKAQLAPSIRQALRGAARSVEQSGLTAWTFGELPREVTQDRGGLPVVAYPALVDEGESVAIRLFEDPFEQDEAHWVGLRRLLALAFPLAKRVLNHRLDNRTRLALAHSPYPSATAVVDDCVTAVLDALMVEHGAPVWDAVAYDNLLVALKAEVEARVVALAHEVGRVLAADGDVRDRLARPMPEGAQAAVADVGFQRQGLVHAGFVAEVGAERVPHLARYLEAMAQRLDAAARDPRRDLERLKVVRRVEDAYARAIETAPADGSADVGLERVGWMIEELRVSLWAQALGTPEPVSEQRITKAIAVLLRA